MKNRKDLKNKKALLISNSRGIALVLVLIVLILMTSLGLSVASTTTIEVQIASRSEEVSKGFYYAEAGLNMAVSMVKQMKGDFNDLLAGPDARNSGIGLDNGLESHRNELVIGTTNDVWPSSSTNYNLLSSNQTGPMFPDDVRGFTKDIGNKPSIDDIQTQLGTSFSNAKTVGDNSRWAGKITFPDSTSNSRYDVLIEVYDDDDPYARLFNAYPEVSGATAYPSSYTGTIAPIYKVPGLDTSSSAYNDYDNCNKEFVECPGKNTSKYSSFSGRNKDFNARVLIRSTARQIKRVGSTDTIVSEVTVDSIVGFFPYPAVITEGCTVMAGSSKILGSYGGIHANDGLCLNGSPTVEQSATSATPVCESCPSSPATNCTGGGGGGIKVCGFSGGNQPVLIIPDLNPLPSVLDPAPPLPQTTPLAYGSVSFSAYASNGWFWVKDVKDKNTNGRTLTNGSDLVFLSKKGETGSQRTVRHGTPAGIENGLLRMMTGMSEDQFEDWCGVVTGGGTKPDPDEAIVFDRNTAAPDVLVASLSGASLSSWYRLSSGAQYTNSNKLPFVGFRTTSGGGGGGVNAPGGTGCTNTTNCPPPPALGPSRANNGTTFDTTSDLNNGAGSPMQKKVLFFDGNLTISGNPGSDTNPFILTFITTGFIDITGTPNFVGQLKAKLDPIAPPFTNPQIIFLAGTDIALSGNTTVGTGQIVFEGVAYAREQVGLTGNCTYTGQVVAADVTGYDSKVANNVLSGSAQVTFKGSTGALGAVRSSSYRVLKF